MFRYGVMFEKKGEMEKKAYIGKMRPFRIIGNTYFVGTYHASAHLIDTGDGLILIDTGYADTAYLVLDSIYQLGFSPKDIKYIINTHWHWDHVEATAAFADLSGAKTLIGREDEKKASAYFKPDILVDDGDTLSLGNTTVRFVHTPGHTRGTISFFYDTEQDGRIYRVGSFGGAGVNTLMREAFDFEGCREAYMKSIQRLKEERVDVFIGNHTWNNDTYGKSLKLLEGGRNEFIDDKLWLKFLENCEERLLNVIESEKKAK